MTVEIETLQCWSFQSRLSTRKTRCQSLAIIFTAIQFVNFNYTVNSLFSIIFINKKWTKLISKIRFRLFNIIFRNLVTQFLLPTPMHIHKFHPVCTISSLQTKCRKLFFQHKRIHLEFAYYFLTNTTVYIKVKNYE